MADDNTEITAMLERMQEQAHGGIELTPDDEAANAHLLDSQELEAPEASVQEEELGGETTPSTEELAEDGLSEDPVSEDVNAEEPEAPETPEEVPEETNVEETPDAEYEELEEVEEYEQEVDVPESVSSEIERLRAELEEQRDLVQQLQASPKEEAKIEDEANREYTVLPFIQNEDEYDIVTGSQDGLNAFANRIHYTTEQAITKQIPAIVQQQLNYYLTAQNTVETFFHDNPELNEYRDYVRVTADNLQSQRYQNGQMVPLEQIRPILDEAKAKAYKELKLRPAKPTLKTKTRPRPAFAKPHGSRQPEPVDSRTEMQRELDEL